MSCRSLTCSIQLHCVLSAYSRSLPYPGDVTYMPFSVTFTWPPQAAEDNIINRCYLFICVTYVTRLRSSHLPTTAAQQSEGTCFFDRILTYTMLWQNLPENNNVKIKKPTWQFIFQIHRRATDGFSFVNQNCHLRFSTTVYTECGNMLFIVFYLFLLLFMYRLL